MGLRPEIRAIPVLLALLTILAMGRLCAADFVLWDDQMTLYQNPHFNPPTWETVKYYWTHEHMGLYVPVTYTVWAGLASIGRVAAADYRGVTLNPYLFHSVNVVLHVANVLLVYAILRRLLGTSWPAAAGAAVFGVHPVQVESVGWVSGMKDLLCATFVLGAVWAYVKSVQAAAVETPGALGRRRRWYWLGLGLMVLAMLSKPTAVATPLILAGLDRWVLRRTWGQVVRALWPWALAVVPCLIWAKLVQTVPPLAPLWARPLIAGDALAFYLYKLVWPATLTLDYGRNPDAVMAGRAWLLTWMAPAAVAVVLWAGRRKRPQLVGAAWVAVAGVGPVLGLTPFMFQGYSTVSDRYLYLPLLGVGLAVAWACSRVPYPKSAAVVVCAILATLTARSVAQAGVWQDDQTLFGHALDVDPDSYIGHGHFALDLEERAKSLATTDPATSRELMDAAEWHIREGIRVRPTHYIDRYNLGFLLVQKGKTHEAIEPLTQAVERFRHGVDDVRILARTHHILGAALWRDGRREEGLAEFERAVACDPASADYRSTLDSARKSLRAATRSATTTRVAATTTAPAP